MERRDRIRRGERTGRGRARSHETGIFNDPWTGPVLMALVTTALIVSFGALPTRLDGAPSDQTATTTVRVSTGETLWDIAAAHRLPGMDTAQTVQAIMRANGKRTAGLRTGESLTVPVAGTGGSAVAQAEGPTTAE